MTRPEKNKKHNNKQTTHVAEMDTTWTQHGHNISHYYIPLSDLRTKQLRYSLSPNGRSSPVARLRSGRLADPSSDRGRGVDAQTVLAALPVIESTFFLESSQTFSRKAFFGD